MESRCAPAGLESLPPVAVILATKGRPRSLERAIESVLANRYPHFRLVVVDQAPEAPEPAALHGLPAHRALYVRTPWCGKSRAINYALTLGDEPIIAFTDDDCAVPPDWLAAGVAALAAEPGAGLLFGSLAAATHDPAKEFIPEFAPRSRSVARGPGSLWNGMLGVGGNLFARRSALAEIGGFDEELGPGGRYRTGEDTELTFRALRRGFSVVQDPAVRVLHYGGRSFVDGAARKSISDAYYALGAGYGKHVRSGDALAAVLFLREVQLVLSVVVRQAVRGQLHGTRARGLVAIFQGGWTGFSASRLPVPPGRLAARA